MTKEEAINVLKTKSCNECFWGCDSPVNCFLGVCDLTKATEIAIESLEMSKWMPIWDKPPDNDGTYLVSYYYDDFGGKRQGVSIATYGNQGKWYFSGHWWNNDDNNGRPIKAWMPLPKRYGE